MAKKKTIKFKGIEFEEVSKDEWQDDTKRFLKISFGRANYKITEHYFIEKKIKGQAVRG